MQYLALVYILKSFLRCSESQAVQALEGTPKKILPHNKTKNTVLRGRNQGLLKNPPQD